MRHGPSHVVGSLLAFDLAPLVVTSEGSALLVMVVGLGVIELVVENGRRCYEAA